MTVTIPTVWYVNFGNGSSTGYYAAAQWAVGTGYTVGQIVRQLASPAVNSERCFVCVVAGTSGGSEPAWSTGKGAKTTDNTVTWCECSGQPALNGDLASVPLSSQNRSGTQTVGNIVANNTQDHFFICTTGGTTGSGEPTFTTTTGGTTVDSGCTWTCLGAVSSFTTKWAAPVARIANCSGVGPGSTVYVSSIHAETVSGSGTLTVICSLGAFPPTNVALAMFICIKNVPSALPPTAADITTGASSSFTGTSGTNMNIGANIGTCAEFNGFTFTCGSSTASFSLQVTSYTGSFMRLRNCGIVLGGSGGQQVILQGTVEFINTTITFGGSASQDLNLNGGSSASFTWRDTPNALAATTTWPTTLISQNGSSTGGTVALIENVDLSAFAGTNLISTAFKNLGRVLFSHCKLPTNFAPSTNPIFDANVLYFDFVNCDTAGATYNTTRYGFNGTQTMTTAVVATGGATDGTTSYAWKLVSSSICAWQTAFESIPISVWNTKTATNVTVTLQGAYVGTALPFNDEIWLDVTYFGTVSSTCGTRATTGLANILSTHTHYSASSTLWGGSAAARQNSHAYSLGNVIGVSSDSSITRAFVCTTAGTSSGSLPGGYASAVDGAQITDGTAVFTAVERFSMSVSLSAPQPQAAGYLVCYVRVGKASGTYFVDPNPVLS